MELGRGILIENLFQTLSHYILEFLYPAVAEMNIPPTYMMSFLALAFLASYSYFLRSQNSFLYYGN